MEEVINDVGGYLVVIKFLDGNYGWGIIINVCYWEEAIVVYDLVVEEFKSCFIIVECYYEGSDYWVLVVNGKLVVVVERILVYVIGDGIFIIIELIDKIN